MTKTILVVDDESIVRNFIVYLLKSDGYQVLAASDGLEALEKIDRHRPDLVITDLAMPLCDGVDLIRTVRRTPQYRALPIILISGSDPGYLLNAIDVGANHALRKPVPPTLLLRCVETWVGETSPEQKGDWQAN